MAEIIETADEKDPNVIRLLKKVGTHEPIYLIVEPEPGAQVNDCFPAVQRKVRELGGKMVMGWQVWKSPNLVEAECTGESYQKFNLFCYLLFQRRTALYFSTCSYHR